MFLLVQYIYSSSNLVRRVHSLSFRAIHSPVLREAFLPEPLAQTIPVGSFDLLPLFLREL